MDSKVIDSLIQIVGDKNVITDKEILETYSHDETPELRASPDYVVKPSSVDEVREIILLANKEKVPIVPRGGGTGLSGGAVPQKGGIVLSFERMNHILEIDTNNLMAVVEPGVVTGELASKVEEFGLMYPPDPASLDSCTIGGNIAENAGGARTVKYGTTKRYVYGLEVVLPTGEIIRTGGKLVKNVVGYNLGDLFVGSEGTLGIFTKAILRLLPKPKYKIDLLMPFKTLEDASNTAIEILRSKILPTAIEFMEKRAIKTVEEYLGKKMPFGDEEAQILIEIDGEDKDLLTKLYEELGEIALTHNAIDVWVAEDTARQRELWEARRSISESLKSRGTVHHEDVVVPISKITDLIKGTHSLESKYNLKIVCYGHIGDGNVHVNILQEDTPKPEWQKKIKQLVRELFELTIKLGGTISGEHGIGLAKKEYISLAIEPEQINLMKKLKKLFDPNNILNPGKIFD